MVNILNKAYKISVRPAMVEDAPDIAKVHVETWQDAYGGLIADDYLGSLSIADRTITWEKQIRESEEGNLILVGCIDDEVLGWATFCPSRDEDADSKTGELGGVYVHPSAQGLGLGSKLMETGLEFLKEQGFETATLWVLTSNKKSRDFYEAKGWQNEGKAKIENRKNVELHETRYKITL